MLLTVLLIRSKICFKNCPKSNVFRGFSEPNQFNKLINVQVRLEGDEKNKMQKSFSMYRKIVKLGVLKY